MHAYTCTITNQKNPDKISASTLIIFSHILIGRTRHFPIALLNFRNKVDTTHTEPPPPPNKFVSVVHIAS